jgi:hypothetical protein
MDQLLKEIHHIPLLWLPAIAPVVLAAQKLKPEAHTLLRDTRHEQRALDLVFGALVLMVYLIFAMTPYLLPPRG